MGDGRGFCLVIVIWRYNIVFWRQGVTSHNYLPCFHFPQLICEFKLHCDGVVLFLPVSAVDFLSLLVISLKGRVHFTIHSWIDEL